MIGPLGHIHVLKSTAVTILHSAVPVVWCWKGKKEEKENSEMYFYAATLSLMGILSSPLNVAYSLS